RGADPTAAGADVLDMSRRVERTRRATVLAESVEVGGDNPSSRNRVCGRQGVGRTVPQPRSIGGVEEELDVIEPIAVCLLEIQTVRRGSRCAASMVECQRGHEWTEI